MAALAAGRTKRTARVADTASDPINTGASATGHGLGAGDHITAKASPMGRLCTAEDVAATALWLASDDANFITGLAIPVDGGRSV